MSYDVNYVRENFHYDPKTGILSWAKPNRGRTLGRPVGNKDKNGHLWVTIKEGDKLPKYSVHRIAWVYVYGKEPSDQIDHINGIKTDNRISNLREANNAQNMRNRGKQENNTSGLKGVSFHSHTKKYRATIQVDGKHIHLGLFDCPAAAYCKYQIAAHTHFGQFAGRGS